MSKRLLSALVAMATIVAMLLAPLSAMADKPAANDNGFDPYGYNRTARIFNGTGLSWCMAAPGKTEAECRTSLGVYANDKLVMKWNAEWDRGNAEGWTDPDGYAAWENNEWNGMVPGGSGAVWHYKTVWISPSCGANYTPLPNGGYCIWGQFETIMDQGVDPNMGPGHLWYAHANPTGYGAYKP